MREWLRRHASGIGRSFIGHDELRCATDIRRYIAGAPALPDNQDRTEVRIQALFITSAFMLLLIEPIFYILLVPGSSIAKVSLMASSPWIVIGPYAAAMILTAPHLADLIFRPDRLRIKWPRRCAAVATLLAALAWLLLANLAMPLDTGPLEWAYAIRTTVCVCIGLIYGFSVNAQQMRERLREPRYAASDE